MQLGHRVDHDASSGIFDIVWAIDYALAAVIVAIAAAASLPGAKPTSIVLLLLVPTTSLFVEGVLLHFISPRRPDQIRPMMVHTNSADEFSV